MKIIIPALFIIVSSSSYLIVEDTGQQFEIEETMYGYIPYGKSIEGNMHFVEDLCQNQNSGKIIILVDNSKLCSGILQLYNARDALAIIFNSVNFDKSTFLSGSNIELESVFTMPGKELNLLQQTPNSRIKLGFPILIQREKPLIQYIVYELCQQIEVPKMLQQFESKGFVFDLKIQYFIAKRKAIEQRCWLDNMLSFSFEENLVKTSGKDINCRQELEVKYYIYTHGTHMLSRLQMLQEYIRQMCILNIYGIEKWREYRSQFINNCLQLQEFIDIYQCSMDLRHSISMEEDDVQQCYANSFYDQNKSNRILDDQQSFQGESYFKYYQERSTLMINSQPIYGNYSLDTNTLFDANKSGFYLAICESYIESFRPQACQQNQIEYQLICNFLCQMQILVISNSSLLIICSILMIALIILYLRTKFYKQATELKTEQFPRKSELEMESQDIKQLQDQRPILG